MLVQTNVVGYLKDTDSGAIINNNDEEYKKFLVARAANKKNNDLCKKMSELEDELRTIKNLLSQLLHGNN